MFFLEQDKTKKEKEDKKTAEQLEFKAGGNNKKYKMEGICDSAVYAKELEVHYLLGLYYLISWKGYPKDKSTWEPASAVQHLRKLVSIFYKNYSNKPIATFLFIDLALSIAKYTALPNVNGKSKHGQPIGSMWKKVKH